MKLLLANYNLIAVVIVAVILCIIRLKKRLKGTMRKRINNYNIGVSNTEPKEVSNADVLTNDIVREMQKELYEGSTDLNKITEVFKLIAGDYPTNINVMKRTILNYNDNGL
jgi:hypothetical protein